MDSRLLNNHPGTVVTDVKDSIMPCKPFTGIAPTMAVKMIGADHDLRPKGRAVSIYNLSSHTISSRWRSSELIGTIL